MDKTVSFEKINFKDRLKGMLKADFRRMFKSRLFYILIACALIAPILMTVMTSMMVGTESVDPNTGEVSIVEAIFTNAWQSIGALPTLESTQTGEMDLTSMCNIDMMFMAVAVFVCLFISDDFRSGYSKNIFAVRSKKSEYVISKTVMGFICGALLLIAYFIGAMIGGKIAGLSFDLGGLNISNVVMCMLSKILLMLVFVPIFVTVSVAAKQRAWLAICGSLGAGMLLFMMVSMISPLSATLMNVLLCLASGALFSFGLGFASEKILQKKDLV